MILYACLVRCSDSMPLSSTNVLHQQMEHTVQEAKNVIKHLGKHIPNIPSRMCVQDENLTVHCMKTESTCFFVACAPSYAHVLAYSFLNELMKEFFLLYTTSVVSAVKRPFGFIEFDSYISNVQQKFNNPRSLASRLNLSDITNDLNINPPLYKNLRDFLDLSGKPSVQSTSQHSSIDMSNGVVSNGVVKHPKDVILRMKPVPLYGRISLLLTLPCIFLDAYRGFVSLHSSSLDDEAPSILHSFSFMSEMIFLTIQMYCLRKHASHRKLISLNCFIFVLLLNFLIYDIRETFVVVIYLLVSSCLCLATFKRNYERCLPDLNI